MERSLRSSAVELGGEVITAALERSGVDPEQVEQVVFGQVLQAGQGQIPSRQAQIEAGIPKEVPSETINKVCASGMRSVGLADQAIRAGDLEVAATGGMESMSNAPYLLPGARFGFRMGDVQAIDAMTHDGLTNPFTDKQMINEASEVSNELEITRADMDRFAERSHRLAAEATDAGRLADEITPVTVKSRKAETVVEVDEAIRPETTLETLAKLRAVGGDDATHTAGNAPGVNDGAAAVIVASSEWAEQQRPPAAGRRSWPTGRSPTTSPTWPRRPPRPPSRRSRRSARRPPTSICGRSTRPSPRSRSTRCGCWASTTTTSTSTAARSPSGTRSAPRAPASSAPSCTSCAAAAAASAAPRSAPAAARAMRSSSRSTGASAMAARAAAFFDLDKTLMAGSSGMVWARVSYESGQISKRLMAQWALDHLRYRLRGATDDATRQVMAEVREMLLGVRARDLQRLGPRVLAGVLPRIYPQMLDEVHDHQDAGRATFIVSAAGVELVEMLASVLGMDGGIGTRYEIDDDGRFTGELDGPFIYGEGKVVAMRRFADEHGIDLCRVLRVLRRGLRPADAAGRRQARRGQPRRGARRGGPRRGLAGDALREAGSQARDRGRDAHGRRRGTLLAAAGVIGWRRVDEQLAFAGSARLADLIRGREVTSRELTELYLERIERLDPKLNAYCSVLADEALAQADDADRRVAAGEEAPFLGVPMAIKDVEDIAGHPTAYGTSGFGGDAVDRLPGGRPAARVRRGLPRQDQPPRAGDLRLHRVRRRSA